MRRLLMIATGIVLMITVFVPAPAGAAKCVEIQGIGDPCALVCRTINEVAHKYLTCELA